MLMMVDDDDDNHCTTPQSAAALSLIRAWSAKTVEVMAKLAQDPSAYLAERMESLEDGSNPELLALFEKAGKGDKAAAFEAQKVIAEQELGGCECLARACMFIRTSHGAILDSGTVLFITAGSPPLPTSTSSV